MEYLFYKLLHIVGVVLFLGNIITGLLWMRFAMETKEMRHIARTMRTIIRLDTYLTNPGVILIIASGVMTAMVGHYPILGTGWILWSIILFSVSGAVFMAKLAPLQRRIAAFAEQASNSDEDAAKLRALVRSWDLWGLIATLTPLAAAVMMVLKIPS